MLFHATLASQLDLHPTAYKALSIPERLGAMSVAGETAWHASLAIASARNLVDRFERKRGDIELGAKVHITGSRISDGDKGTYTVFVK